MTAPADALAAARQLVAAHGIAPRGLIHIGASGRAPAAGYRELGFARVLVVDRRAAPAEDAAAIIDDASIGAAGETGGWIDRLITAQPRAHLATRLDTLGLDPRGFNVLTLDLADSRRALAGAASVAGALDAVLVRAAPPAVLAGLDRCLFDRGLLRLAPEPGGAPRFVSYLRSALIRAPHATGGLTRAAVGMANFGHNAGFANQLFQYAFLKLYGLRNNCAVETPEWAGEAVYGIPGLRIKRRRPEYRGDEWSVRDLALWTMDAPPVDVDFWGYYQNIPASWRQHRDFLRRMFQPLAPWRAPVERWLAQHRPPGATLVALHLRRGDYHNYAETKPWFRIIPEDAYRRWLDAIWPTLANPVLFIASDDRDSVLSAFADYAPLTAAALEPALPEPRLLADFQLLAAADVLAICNSSFSRMAALLAQDGQRCFIPAVASGKFEPYAPWDHDLFWQRFGAPLTPGRRSLLPRWLRRRA